METPMNSSVSLVKTQVKETNLNDIHSKIEALSESVQDKTTTKSEKEKAISVKKQIIQLLQVLLSDAKKKNNIGLAQSLNNQIDIVTDEINTINSEIKNMSSVFDSAETPENSKTKMSSKDSASSIFT